MKYIYLDNNIIIDLENERNPKVIDTVNKLREDGHRIVFSPAHLEEIANLVKHHEQTEESQQEDYFPKRPNGLILPLTLPYEKPTLD